MNPLHVHDMHSALMAVLVGMLAGAIVTIFLHYSGTSLSSLAGKIAGTTA